MNTLVSGIKYAKATACKDLDLCEMLEGLREGRWKDDVEKVRAAYRKGGREAAGPLKERMKGILFSGRFSCRNAASLISHSGLIVADFDDLDKLPGDGLKRVRNGLHKSPNLFALFLSVTGSGLKALFRVSDVPKLHKASFKAVARHCHELTGVKIDESGSDVCRNCFVSYDPNLFVNLKAVALALQESPETPGLYRVVESRSNGVAESPSSGEAEKPRNPETEDVLPSSPPPETTPATGNPAPLTPAETGEGIAKHRLVPTGKHQTNRLLFRLARLGRSFAASRERALTNEDLRVLFDAWHGAAQRLNPEFVWRTKSEYWLEFLGIYPVARFPIETEPLPLAWKLANEEPLPPGAEQFQDDPKTQRLLALCYQLAKMNCEGPGVFFLGCRPAAALLDYSQTHAATLLRGFVAAGFLELITKGERRGNKLLGGKVENVASRYRWRGTGLP
jgi:hypothetical protein